MIKVAHLIMAHSYPIQLERLIAKLEHPQCSVFVHLDKKANIADFVYLANAYNVIFISQRTECNWGGFSFVIAITESLREILSSHETFDSINLLSAQDYLIKPVDFIYEFLKQNSGTSFISYDKSPTSDWWRHAVTRYELYHFTDYNVKGRYMFQGLLNRLMPKRKFPWSVQLFGSSDSSWWILHRDCAQYILDFMDSHPKLLNFMKYTWGADEFFYTTIIMNSPFKRSVVNDNLRYIEWEDGKARPRTFILSDLEKLKDSRKLFARKFDLTIDCAVLEELDNYLEDCKTTVTNSINIQ